MSPPKINKWLSFQSRTPGTSEIEWNLRLKMANDFVLIKYVKNEGSREGAAVRMGSGGGIAALQLGGVVTIGTEVGITGNARPRELERKGE